MTYRLLNLACGSKTSKLGDWVNVDFQSPLSDVVEMNILRGLDFPDSTFDVVYSAQFIEHLTISQAHIVFRNISRIMKPGGVIRLVTPDLEEMVQTYLKLLQELKINLNAELINRYDWVRLEIFDQIVRDSSGGEVPTFIKFSDADMRRFIIDRIGYTASTLFNCTNTQQRTFRFIDILRKINRIPRRCWAMGANFFSTDAMRVGRFRQSGEVHRYLHDIYSLTRLLESVGFHSIKRVSSTLSDIPEWNSYNLDVVDGIVDGPLSLYVEARR